MNDSDANCRRTSRAAIRQPDALLLEEIKLGCTLGMLQCLDRPLRLAYILGEILEMDHMEAAAVLEVLPAAYRKRLSRARSLIVTFMKAKCGLVQPANGCACGRRVEHAVRSGRVSPDRLLFAQSGANPASFERVLSEVRKLEEGRRAAALYRSAGESVPPALVTHKIRELLSRMT